MWTVTAQLRRAYAAPSAAFAWLLLMGAGLTGCGLQKDVDVELPALPAQLVVECYLESGKVPELTVTESVPYLSTPQPEVPTDVTAVLTYPGGRADTLRFRPGLNPATRKAYTHRGRRAIFIRPGDTYRLDVRDQRGRHVFGTATLTPPVPIDTVEWVFNDRPGDQRKAYVLTKFDDPAGSVDFYRFQVHRDSLTQAPEVEYYPEDRLLDGQRVVLGTSYDFAPDDDLIITLYRLDQAYYNFLRSISDARSANGNPFGQPAQVQSTVEGGIGVFTILNYQRRQITIR